MQTIDEANEHCRFVAQVDQRGAITSGIEEASLCA